MGNLVSSFVPPPSQKMLVPPFFDNLYLLAARNRSMESKYNLMFAKNIALRSLFDDYFEPAEHFRIRMITLNLDQFSDFIVTVSGPMDRNSEERIVKNAELRVESNQIVPGCNAILDICVSNTEPILLMRSSTYFSDLGTELFSINPIFMKEAADGQHVVGFTSVFPNALCGATHSSSHREEGFPHAAWAVAMIGPLSAGVQYEPKFGRKDGALHKNLANWSFAVSYSQDLVYPFIPRFNFGLQLANNKQFIASFYQHMVIQRRVINPLERNEVAGITNYIDLGFEWQANVDGYKYLNKIRDSTFQVVASWQANKNLLVKGKMGPLSSSIALAFKSWWKPALTFNVSAIKDHTKSGTSFGFGFQVDNIHIPYKNVRHQRATPNYAMETPSKLEDILY